MARSNRGFLPHIFTRIRTVLILVLVCLPSVASAQHSEVSAKEAAKQTLDEIIKFKKVAPRKSYELIKSKPEALPLLSNTEQVSWLSSAVSIAFSQGDTELAESSLRSLVLLNAHQKESPETANLLMYVGHMASHEASYDVARTAYACAALREPELDRQFYLLYSMSLVLFLEGEYAEARDAFSELNHIANQKRHLGWQSNTSNALGVLALELGDYNEASQMFRTTMDIEHNEADRDSEVIAGGNLLLAFMLDENFLMYDRLQPRITRLTSLHGNRDLMTYLSWISAAATKKRGNTLNEGELESLKIAFEQIADENVKQPIRAYLAQVVEIDLGENVHQPETHAYENIQWITRMFDDLDCPEKGDIEILIAKKLNQLRIESAIANE